MYNNPYVNNYGGFNQQINTPDQNYLTMLDNEKGKIEKIKENYLSRFQTQQPTLNQTIQVTPTAPNVGIRYANTIEDVQKELAIVDTPFVNNSYSTLWVKNAKGDIRTFELTEIIPKDDKDILIEKMQLQIDKLNDQIKEMNRYEQQYDQTSNEHESEQLDEPITNKTTSNVSNAKSSKSKSR